MGNRLWFHQHVSCSTICYQARAAVTGKGSQEPIATSQRTLPTLQRMPSKNAPGPGHELRTMSQRWSSSMRPAVKPPYDWKADTMSRVSLPPSLE